MLPFDFVHDTVWELDTSAATPPLLFSVASKTCLAGQTSLSSTATKTQTFKGQSMATERVAVQFRQYYDQISERVRLVINSPAVLPIHYNLVWTVLLCSFFAASTSQHTPARTIYLRTGACCADFGMTICDFLFVSFFPVNLT